MKGIPSHVFPTAFSSCPSAPLSQDSSPAKTHGAWLQGLMKLRLLMSHCKNSVRDTMIGNRWICSDLERGTIQECGPLQSGVPWQWNVVWVMECGVVSFH